jgi:hypothetical protein
MWKIVSRLFFLSTALLLHACAVKQVELPVYEGIDVGEVLSSKNRISSIETAFSVAFERHDTEIRGDGVLDLRKNGDLKMRVYSFGFLAFEITAENGVIKSNPVIDKNKKTMLTYGLRECFFWWDMKEFEIEERGNDYLLKNSARLLWIDRKTMFPIKQVVFLDDGRELDIFYEDPEKAGEIWYPSKIRIELSRYAVTLKIKEISFISDGYPEVDGNRLDDRIIDDISFGEVSFEKCIIANGVDEPGGSVCIPED